MKYNEGPGSIDPRNLELSDEAKAKIAPHVVTVEAKPQLEYDREAYGCTIRYSFHGERAVLIDRDGVEHEFEENRGMVAQGAPNALLLALAAAKKDEAARIEAKRTIRNARIIVDKDTGEVVRIEKETPNGPRAPADVVDLVNQGEDVVLDDESEGNQ